VPFDRQGHECNGRHPPDAAIDHMVDALLVKKPAVLERVDLGGERVANTVETFCMHGDALALRPSLGHRHANHVDTELRLVPAVGQRSDPAGGADLYKTRPRHQSRAHQLAHLLGAIAPPARKPGPLLEAESGWYPGIAMTAGLRDHDDRDQESRPLNEPLRDRLTKSCI